MLFSLHFKALSGTKEHWRWGDVALPGGKSSSEHLQREWPFICFCFHRVIFDFGVYFMFYIKEIFAEQPVLSQVTN